MPMTVINGPPERSRTRSPLRNGEAAGFDTTVFDGEEADRAGDKGIQSATPNVTATAIEACFMDVNILNSILELYGLQKLIATRLHRPANSQLQQ
jgi:hypothetical protein